MKLVWTCAMRHPGGSRRATMPARGMLQKVPAARLVIPAATSHIGISGESAVPVPMASAFLDDVTASPTPEPAARLRWVLRSRRVQTPARVNVTCVTPLGEEVASTS
jgi:hypothetical protein